MLINSAYIQCCTEASTQYDKARKKKGIIGNEVVKLSYL